MIIIFTGTCSTKAFDIVFAIDTSSSIWKPDFELELKFIKDISQQFDIGLGHEQSRVGVVTFADHHYLQFHLWQNNRRDLLERALNRIRHRAGRKTNTAAAIKVMPRPLDRGVLCLSAVVLFIPSQRVNIRVYHNALYFMRIIRDKVGVNFIFYNYFI